MHTIYIALRSLVAWLNQRDEAAPPASDLCWADLPTWHPDR